MNPTDQEIAQLSERLDPENPNRKGARIDPPLRLCTLLCERNAPGDLDLARRVLAATLDLQKREEPNQGAFPMTTRAKEYSDLNANLFLLPGMMRAFAPIEKALEPDITARLRQSIALAIAFAERRWDEEVFDPPRDFKCYSNVFLLWIQALMLGADFLSDARLKRKAQAQWTRWFYHTSYGGIDEFASPTYCEVDVEALCGIRDATDNPQMRRECELVLEYLFALSFGVSHPRLKLPICGASRDYRGFVRPGNGEIGFMRDAAADIPHSVRAEYQARQFPHQVSGRATGVPFRFKSWQDENCGVGSATGGHYFWQQIHWMCAVGEDAMQRAVVFAPGNYSISPGFVAQDGPRALCLWNRRRNSFLGTQRPTPDERVFGSFGTHGIGISEGWQELENASGRLVLSAYEHELRLLPFVVRDGQIEACQMRRVSHQTAEFQGSHRRPLVFDEYLFPDDALWFGCLALLSRPGEAEPTLTLPIWREAENVVTLQADELNLRLFLQPSGETTQLFAPDDDPRAAPLLQTPAYTLWPGQWTRLMSQSDSL